jgi:hypothetical protein
VLALKVIVIRWWHAAGRFLPVLGHGRQMLGSLIVAAIIVALAIIIVTAKFGPTSAAEREDGGGSKQEHSGKD